MITYSILIFISLFVAGIAIRLLLNIKKITIDGEEVKGIIFDIESLPGIDINIQYPIVRFLTKENIWITASSSIGKIPGMHKKGKEVIIIYQKDNPNNFLIKENLTYLIPSIMLIIAFSLAILGIFHLIHI